jgi:hypothetical protein
MKITRITVLHRHVSKIVSVLDKNRYMYCIKKLRGGVVIVHFDYKDLNTTGYVFGIPFSMETKIKGQSKALKMSCLINNEGRPSYQPDSILDYNDWVEQESMFIKNNKL